MTSTDYEGRPIFVMSVEEAEVVMCSLTNLITSLTPLEQKLWDRLNKFLKDDKYNA